MYPVKSAGLLALLLGGVQLCSAAPLEADADLTVTGGPIIPAPTVLPPIITLPAPTAGCTSIVNGVTKAPSCYVHTATVTNLAGTVPSVLACPLIIHVTTKDVPCANACCPTTKTRTVTKTVDASACVIPTETVIRTTGCKVATALPTAILTLAN